MMLPEPFSLCSVTSAFSFISSETNPTIMAHMEHLSSTSSAEDISAAVINTAVERQEQGGDTSYQEFATTVEDIANQAGVETPQVDAYIGALRTFSHDAAIGALPEGVGGQFDGAITIATNTVEVGADGVDKTIARMQEVYDHELYHALNGHTDAMMTWDGAPTVVIAGEGFDTTEVIEGLTVTETGEEFVSGGYKQHKSDLNSAIAKAGLNLDDVRNAVNEEHDFGLIDDRQRDPVDMDALVA